MKTYFTISVKVRGNCGEFYTSGKRMDNYPTDEQIEAEMKRLKEDGYAVYFARVEKRYALI